MDLDVKTLKYNGFLKRRRPHRLGCIYFNEYCELAPLYIPLLQELFTCDSALIPRHLETRYELPIISQVQALDSVNWSRRNVPRKRNDPAKHASRNSLADENNHNKRCKQRSISSSDDSDSEGAYAYRKLSRSEKSQNINLYSFIGKIFQDFDENDGSTVDGFVVDVVMEKVESTICFEYYLSSSKQNDEKDHNYIVAEYAVDQCQWSGEQAHQKDSTIQKPQQKQWRGYKI